MPLYAIKTAPRAEAVAADLRLRGFVATAEIRYSGPHVSIEDGPAAEQALLELEPSALPAGAGQ